MKKYEYEDKQHAQFSTKNLDWFKNVFGFEEDGIKSTSDISKVIEKIKNFNINSPVNKNLEVNYSDLNNVSIIGKIDSSKKYNVGKVKFVSTGNLLQSITKVDTADVTGKDNGLKYYVISGNTGPLHYDPQLKGSLFQVASQFNALEMNSQKYIPEYGITIYVHDGTQGPACALACPYATLYRNYFSMPGGKPQSGIPDLSGNTSDQINTLEEFEKTSGVTLKKENGYFYTKDDEETEKINDYLSTPENFWESVKLVKYFIHEDTPVVSAIDGSEVQKVAQIYCSALPLAYFPILKKSENFTKMILCAIYYATFAQAVVMAQTKGERVKVLITNVGGGVFVNPPDVINAAINSALTFFKDYPIDVYYVNFKDSVTEFINTTTESPYPDDKDKKITPPASFQVGGADPSSDNSGIESTQMGSDTTPPPPPPNCTIDTATQSITNITPECQEDIFKLATPLDKPSVTEEEPKNMSNLVSAIGADYSTKYASEAIMPAGSATLLYIGDTNLYNITQSGSNWSPGSVTATKIKYMIHASPAKSDNVKRDISKDTISNSVMNSLILAAKNGVKKIIFPFIGGVIFYNTLKENVDAHLKDGDKKYDKEQHAAVLVKGVTDFYKKFSSYGISTNPIEEIYFLTFSDGENNEEQSGMQKAITQAISSTPLLNDILKQLTKGTLISNVIPPHGKENIDAIVNAGNTNHGFATGSGIADMCFAGLNDNQYYQKKLDTIKEKFIEAFNAYIKKPNAAPPPSTPPTEPAPPPEKPKVAFAEVLKGLEGQLTNTPDTDADISSSEITLPDFLYPPSETDAGKKKNLNCATPLIKDMIEAFETADEGDTNFYLGACRSIQAAYQLERGDKTDDTSAEAMRAKLLLNLRKNSLLLKVPAWWDYKEMKMGKVSGPPDTLDKLMNYSLQDTIEYYSQDQGNEGKLFRALNIAKEPEMKLTFTWYKNNHTINGVDKRFTKGISNEGNTCFFNAALQLLLCNEDFLQLMIQGNCQDNFIDSIKKSELKNSEDLPMCSHEKFNKSKETIQFLLSFFEKWLKNESFKNDGENQVVKIVKALSDVKGGGQGDSSEILVNLFESIGCCKENYILKFYDNSVTSLKITEKSPKYKDIHEKEVENVEAPSPVITLKSEQINTLMIENKLSENECKKVTNSVQDLIDYYTSEQQIQYNIQSDSLNDYDKLIYDYIKRLYKTAGAAELNIFGLLHLICSKIDREDISSFITTSNSIDVSSDESFNTIVLIKDMAEFSGIKSDFETIYTFLNKYNKKFNNENIKAQCENITKISDFVLKLLDSLVNPSGIFKVKKTEFKKIGKYVILYLGDRSLKDSSTNASIKNLMNVKINKNITLNGNTYILQGYSVHVGTKSTGSSHYVFIKCDPKSGEEKLILDDSHITNVDSRTLDDKQRGVYALIYKKGESDVPASPGGGGFKPKYNAATNNVTSKSKHNSSFKVSSSSKSKTKTKNRSHTQRVK
jgi:ubiquitin C-terminal hydrolase